MFAFKPLASATAAIEVPGCRASSMTRALNSAECRLQTATSYRANVLRFGIRSVHVSTHLFVDTSILRRPSGFNGTWPDGYTDTNGT